MIYHVGDRFLRLMLKIPPQNEGLLLFHISLFSAARSALDARCFRFLLFYILHQIPQLCLFFGYA